MTSITCYGSYLCINFRFPLHDKFWNVAKADSKGCWIMMLQKRDVNSPKRLLKKKAFEVKMICCHQESILLWTKRGPAEMDSRLFQNIGNPFYERIGGKEEEDRIDLQSLYRYRLRWSQSDMSIKINLTLLLLLNPLLLFTTCLLFESVKSLRKPSLKLHLQLGWVGCQDTCIIFQGKNLFLYEKQPWLWYTTAMHKICFTSIRNQNMNKWTTNAFSYCPLF